VKLQQAIGPGAARPVKGAFEWLEPCAVKVACAVLRGLGGSNAPRLPDHCFRFCSVSGQVWSHCASRKAAELLAVRVRHEVVQVAVMTATSYALHGDVAGRNPLFCQWYPTQACVTGNGGV
jgi:hypothetical protein